ncbi:MAG: nucleotide-binding protein [Dehalococcoidia bacterium]
MKCFGSDSVNIATVMNVGRGGIQINPTDEWYEQRRAENLDDQLKLLESCIDQLEIDRDLASEPSPGPGEQARTRKPPAAKAFIVHGHDKAIRDEVARFLEKLEIKPIILMEQPNLGQTLIEKLEQQHGAPYAVVLCTADDLGRVKDGGDVQPRPRQNVVLELGYFIGARGRKNVCVLMSQGLEMPTDIHGIGYLPIDAGGGWKLSLAKEMKVAGLPVDLNKALEG